MTKIALHLGWFAMLTILTQLGGLAWLVGLCFRRRWLVFAISYVALAVGAFWVAPLTGRVALPCFGDGPLKVHSPLYCALNRTYVVPELAEALTDVAEKTARDFPGTTTRILDGSFPFGDGFPLLPHLSHDDGRKADIAFFYEASTGFLPDQARSPLGYFAFQDGPTDCPKRRLTLRWDLGWLQPLFPDYAVNVPRMQTMLRHLAADPRIGKILLEPHLTDSWGATHPKVRFQGCRAARHDDHIHVQL